MATICKICGENKQPDQYGRVCESCRKAKRSTPESKIKYNIQQKKYYRKRFFLCKSGKNNKQLRKGSV